MMILCVLLTLILKEFSVVTSKNVETCSSCDIIKSCDVEVCGSKYVNGTMLPEYIEGCQLSCPQGRLVCRKNAQGKLSWNPVDPCATTTSTTTTTTTTTITTTTTTTTSTTANTTTTTTPVTALSSISDNITTLPIPIIRNLSSYPTSHATENYTAHGTVEIVSSISPNSTAGWFSFAPEKPSLPANGSHGTSSTKHTKSPSDNWVIYWLVPILAICTVGCTTVACVLLVMHLRRKRGKVYLFRQKRDGQYEPVMHNTVEQASNGTGYYSYQPGKLSSIGRNGSQMRAVGTSSRTNGTLLAKSPSTSKGKGRRKKGAQGGAEHRLADWQDYTTENFVTPPSPRLVTGLRPNRLRTSSCDITKSPGSHSPSAFHPTADVVPLRRSPSPLSSQFGEIQSMTRSGLFDTQNFGNKSSPMGIDANLAGNFLDKAPKYGLGAYNDIDDSRTPTDYISWSLRPSGSFGPLSEGSEQSGTRTTAFNLTDLNSRESASTDVKGNSSPRIPRI